MTGWLSIVVTPQSALVSSLVPVIRTSTIVSALALSGVALLFAYFILGRITGPIKKLMSAMRSVGEGDFQTRVEVTRKDEFGLLSQRFNRMNDRIHMLVKENYEIKLKEKEAEIQALNMQMNPHFLYNTLNIMNWTAIENEQKELSKMLVCLSNMLHYTSRKDWGAVHLSEELEWMRNYFYIMAARFEGKFERRLRDRARRSTKKSCRGCCSSRSWRMPSCTASAGWRNGGVIAIRGWTDGRQPAFRDPRQRARHQQGQGSTRFCTRNPHPSASRTRSPASEWPTARLRHPYPLRAGRRDEHPDPAPAQYPIIVHHSRNARVLKACPSLTIKPS